MQCHLRFKRRMFDAIKILRWVGLTMYFLGSAVLVAQELPLPGDVPPSLAGSNEREYVIGTNDRLSISEWQTQSFSTQGMVRTDGKITIAYLGDVQAAGLKVSTFRKNLEMLLKKYVKQPMINLTVGTSGRIRITAIIEGISLEELELPRETKLLSILQEMLPKLSQMQPPPDLANLKVIGSDQEEYRINGLELLAGRLLHTNIRLEWGDRISIPSHMPPDSVPAVKSPETMLSPVKQAIFRIPEFEEFLKNYPPDIQEALRSVTIQPDEQTYMIDLTNLSEDQRQILGDEVLQELEKYVVVPSQAFTHFTEITLAAISIHLIAKEKIEAYLAIPNLEPGQLPTIQRFQEGDIVQQGIGPEEQIVLKEIQDTTNQVILQKGEELQALQLPPALTQAKLAGIVDTGDMKKAIFSNLPGMNETNRPKKQRMFAEYDHIEEAVKIAKITHEWVLLQKGEQTQLVLLRDSLNRRAPSSISQPIPSFLPESSDVEFPDTSQRAEPALPTALSVPLQSIDSLSSVFFATPLF